MAVYVDKPQHKFGQMIMCHMLADTVQELHEMADKLHLQRSWFQCHSTPHYDICKAKRKLAIQFGAVEADRKTVVGLIRSYRAQTQTKAIK